jgi:hypothetical protein
MEKGIIVISDKIGPSMLGIKWISNKEFEEANVDGVLSKVLAALKPKKGIKIKQSHGFDEQFKTSHHCQQCKKVFGEFDTE